MTSMDTPHVWRAELPVPPSPRLSHTRSQSISSDQPSSTGYGGLQSPLSMTSPDPIYIAASAASQIVTNDQDSRSDPWFDQNGIEPSSETALVTPGALKLVNSFLDQLLFNFLSIARSTSLSSLRPAVTEALKPKLAKDAINNADQELQEYSGDGEDEELLAFHSGIESSENLDLELLWKRMRLRCMVYSSLGDMEEEEEDHWTEHEQLDGLPGSNNSRFSGNQTVVSPAVAIFLTSILEFMGEQTLIVAGQAAYQRLRAKHDREARDGVGAPNDIADRMVVDELDMERVALDRTLGRLWRGWKKRIRGPSAGVSMSRSYSRESMRSRGHSRRGSIGNESHVPVIDEADGRLYITEMPENQLLEHERAASIPLPMDEDDLREIEIPGLARQSDGEDEDSESGTQSRKPRPKSLVILRDMAAHPSPATSEPDVPVFSSGSRKRSISLPSPTTLASMSSLKKKESDQTDAAEDSVPTSEMKMGAIAVEPTASREPEKPMAEPKANGMQAGSDAVAVPKREAPTGVETLADEINVEDFTEEEPQVMTSARISLDRTVFLEEALTRLSSGRSQSIHSVKLVDVPSPRSPSRSRHNSVGSFDLITSGRSLSLSRSDSLHTPITPDGQILRGASPIQRGTNASPIIRSSSSLGAMAARNSVAGSISEDAEIEAGAANPSSSMVTSNSVLIIPERSPLREVATLASSDEVVTPDSEKPNMSANIPLFGAPEVAFILDDAPVMRAARPITTVSNIQHSIGSGPHLGFKVLDSGVPPLTPLRELMEGAPDTSDEASSIAPSDGLSDTYGQSSMMSGSPNYRSLDGNRSQETPRSTPRSLYFRTSPQAQRDDDGTPRPDRTPRRLHTSGSSTSSGSHKVRPIRTSEDSLPNTAEDKSKSFEQLLHNDQTIQYTLTPHNVREIESPDSPRHARLPSHSNTSDTQRPRTSLSASKSTGLNSPTHVSRFTPASPKSFIPAQRQLVSSVSRIRPSAPEARDARAERDSIGDFADFIRSTGPPGVSPNIIPKSVVNGAVGNTSAPGPRSGSMSAPVKRTSSSAGRLKLQAREAVVPARNNTSDLIDFIRQGPPNANTRENPRIPRTVAPFRTTMDSDQMSSAIAGPSSPTEDRFSQASNNQSTQSIHSSMNSQSALLSSHKPAAKAALLKYGSFEEEGMIPKRKTRRVRDPYAINFSDEDEDDNEMLPEPRRDQESLIDFLKSVPPPSTSSVFDDVPKSMGKKPSHQSLMSRFSRTSTPQLHKSNGSRPATRPKNDAPQAFPLHIPITITPNHAPESRPSTQRSAPDSTYVSRMNKQRNPAAAPSGRVLQKSYAPREATNATISRGTSDLADFLMNTPPPPNNAPQSFAYVTTGGLGKENGQSSSSFSRMFARRKKVAA